MAGFDDLLAAAIPYLDWEEMAVTQGTTWEWSYLLLDDSKVLVDLTVGFTGTMSIRTRNGDTDLVTVGVTFPAAGAVTCTAVPTATDEIEPGRYYHELTLTRTSDSAVLIAIGAEDSIFVVKKKVAL